MNKGDIVMKTEGNKVFMASNSLVTGVVEIMDVQGSMFLGRALNESGTYNYVKRNVEDFHTVV